jgi:integrase
MARLSATKVKNGKTPGRYSDGDSLYLLVRDQSGKLTKSWVFRWRDRGTGTLRDMGLGPFPAVSLQAARSEALACRGHVAAGRDPKRERDRLRAELLAQQGHIPTFDACSETYIAAHAPGWKNAKHAAQWRATLTQYATPVIGKLPVNLVTSHHVLHILTPIWQTKTETASRVRGRIESVLDWAASPSRRYREGENPARWRGHLDKELVKPARVKKVRHHKALPYGEMHDFTEALKPQKGAAARCLELTILTAVRTSEAIGARWAEIDVDAAVWTIPGERIKGKKEHRVPLSAAALAVLEAQRGHDETFVFPGAAAGSHLSNMAMLELLKGMQKAFTVHGFRSSFRDWAAETTNFPREVCEMALAHTLRDKTEAAYRRGDLFEKRRKLMDAWSKHCATKPVRAAITPIRNRSSV